MRRTRQEFVEYMNSLPLVADYSDSFKVDNKIYQMLGDGYQTKEGVDIGSDKVGFSTVITSTNKILDFLIVLPVNKSSTYTLYYFNNESYSQFNGYSINPDTEEFILDSRGRKIPLYTEFSSSLDEALKLTMRDSETYMGAQPDNNLVFTYYCYLLIQKFLEEKKYIYDKNITINCKT